MITTTTYNTMINNTKRTVTIELTNRQWALLSCALSVGCHHLPKADEHDLKVVYSTVTDAVFPE